MTINYNNLTVQELRTKVREHKDVPANLIVSMSKQQCLDYLELGIIPSTSNNSDSNEQSLITAIKAIAGNSLDQSAIESIIDKKLSEIKPQIHQINVNLNDNKIVEIKEQQHYYFELILKVLCARDHDNHPLNVGLVGSAGVGKTRLCKSIAQALDLPFYVQSYNDQLPASALLGYNDATGIYRESIMYKALKNGGVYVADEFDASSSEVAIICNAVMANRLVTFPNGETVEAHQNFIFIACLNTYGTGATEQYQARNSLDDSTLDRLVLINLPLDASLEASFIGITQNPQKIKIDENVLNAQEWLNIVRSYRFACSELNLRHSITPRATIYGHALLKQLIGKQWLVDWLLIRGLDQATRQTLTSKANDYLN